MFRTLLIEEGERLSVAHQVLQIEKQGRRISVPIADIHCIVLDNLKAVVTTAAINAPYRVVTKQMGMTQGRKDAMWDKIVKGKLANQAEALRLCTGDMDAYHRLMELADEVEEGVRGIEKASALSSISGTSLGMALCEWKTMASIMQ